MTTVYAWSQLTPEQQAAAQASMVGVTADGLPPSGPCSLLWALTETTVDGMTRIEWRWKSAIWPSDVEAGVEIGRRERAR